MHTTLSSSLLAVVTTLFMPSAFGYGLWEYNAGRNDYSGRYDLTGYAWSSGSGVTYDFGNVGTFATLPTGVNTSWLESTVATSGNDWEQWAKVSFGDTLGSSGTGKVRLATANLGTTPAHTTSTLSGSFVDYATITFTDQITWNKESFLGVLKHELGHVLGLDDLYESSAPYSEEFVDHPVLGNTNPQRPLSARQDNMMAGDAPGWWYDKTIIDNDEIAGVTWLWGSDYNQIVTGDLKLAWNGNDGRNTEEHHGDQLNPSTEGWWDYRTSILPGGSEQPYVDIEFPGYERFAAQTYSGASVTYGGNQGGNVERFIVDQAGWGGNLDLYVKSSYTEETRVRSWINGGSRTDDFTLPINTKGRTFDGVDSWALIFGPLGTDQKDFGDAPDSYRTLLASDGPRYDEGDAQRLGYRWDKEPDGQPTPLANGDDLNLWWGVGGPDDEDGVFFGSDFVDILVSITRPGLHEYHLDAWWDLNDNGFFDHATELLIDEIFALNVGQFLFHFDLGFDPLDYYSRFRLTWIDDPFGLFGGVSRLTDVTPWGEFLGADGISHGEVEDYVPEPTTLALMTLGLAGIGWKRRKAA